MFSVNVLKCMPNIRTISTCSKLLEIKPRFGAYKKTDLLRYSPLINYESKREKTILRIRFNRKNCQRHPYTKPLDFKSGDLTTDQIAFDPNELKEGFDQIDQWDSEELKKLYTMEYADGGELKEKRFNILLEKYQEYPGDRSSYQSKIAWMTAKIRALLPHCYKWRKDKVAKGQLLEYIAKRTKCLRKLYEKDREKFNWILNELQIKYQPFDKEYRRLTKKQQRMKVAKEACMAMKQARLQEYCAKLAKEKDKFMIEKEKQLKEVEEGLKLLGIEADVNSPVDVYKALGLGEPYIPDPSKIKTRKQLEWEYNMKKYGHRRFKKVGPPQIINGVPQYT